jgi:CRISPR-associated protein (Cas_Cas2CT1978)
LWKRVTNRPPLGYVLQVWSTNSPQGFAFRQYGTSKRELVDYEGLALVSVKKNSNKKANPGETPF